MSTPNGRRLPSGWFQLPRNLAQTSTLSLAAKGLYVYLLSFPDDWEFYFSKIERDCGIGRDKRIALFNELETHGLITQGKIRLENGRFGYDFTVGDPVVDFTLPPCPEKPYTVEPKTAPSGLIENNQNNGEFILSERQNGAAPKEEEKVSANAGQAIPLSGTAKAHLAPFLQSPSSIAPNGHANGSATGSKGQLSAELEETNPPDTDITEMMEVLADLTATDPSCLLPEESARWQRGVLAVQAKGATAKGLRSWNKWYLRKGQWQEVEYQQDWRGRKEQRPTPAIISETYTAFKRDVERVKSQMGRV